MIGKTNAGSGSASLNFKVIAYNSEVDLLTAKPPENTIGVVTNNKITAWVFADELPQSLGDGAVWFQTGAKSPVAFNALRTKNGILICPRSAKQYVSGVLIDLTCKSYQNGTWVDWWDGTLYKRGNEYTEFTGGWEIKSVSSSTNRGTLTKNADSMRVSGSAAGALVGATTVKAIDMSGYNKLHVIYTNSTAATRINVATEFPTSTIAASMTAEKTSVETEAVVDISALSGMHFVNIADNGTLGNLYIYEVWLT